MAAHEINIREHGFALIARVRRWLIAGAVGLSGVLSLAAANAFHAHARTVNGQASSATSSPASSQPSGGDGSLQQPAQAPRPVQTAPSSPVVSGGS